MPESARWCGSSLPCVRRVGVTRVTSALRASARARTPHCGGRLSDRRHSGPSDSQRCVSGLSGSGCPLSVCPLLPTVAVPLFARPVHRNPVFRSSESLHSDPSHRVRMVVRPRWESSPWRPRARKRSPTGRNAEDRIPTARSPRRRNPVACTRPALCTPVSVSAILGSPIFLGAPLIVVRIFLEPEVHRIPIGWIRANVP